MAISIAQAVEAVFLNTYLSRLKLSANIGTYGSTDIRPAVHILNLTLGISIDQVLIAQDGMARVFDDDPLILKLTASQRSVTMKRRNDSSPALPARVQHILQSST